MNNSWQFVALAAGITALCVFGSADGAYGLELVSADLHTGTQILTVVFDEDVDPDSVDASKFYLGARDSVFGRVALTGAYIAVDGTTVSFTLDTDQMTWRRTHFLPAYLTIGATAVADSTGDPFGIRLEFVDDTILRSSFEQDGGRYQAQGMDFNSDGSRVFIGYEDHISEYALVPCI